MKSRLNSTQAKEVKVRVKILVIVIIAITAGFFGRQLWLFIYPKASQEPDLLNEVIRLCPGLAKEDKDKLEIAKLKAEVYRLEREKDIWQRPAFWAAVATILATGLGAILLYANGYFDAKLASLDAKKRDVENLRKEIISEKETLSVLKSERDALSSELAYQKMQYIQKELKTFFVRVERDVELLWRLCRRPNGIIIDALSRCSYDSPEEDQLQLIRRLNNIFVPVIEDHELTFSNMIVDSEGLEYVLLHERDYLESQEEEFKPYEWRNRIMRKDHWGQRVIESYWDDSSALNFKGKKWIPNLSERLGYLQLKGQEIQYDPRDRMYAGPWLRPEGSEKADHLWKRVEYSETGMHWTPPYFFYTTKAPGITVSKGWKSNDHSNRKYVIAVDIRVTKISQETLKLKVGKRGMVFVFTEEGRVIGLPAHERFDAEDPNTARQFFESLMEKKGRPQSDQEALLPTLEDVGRELGVVAISEAYKEWKRTREAGHEEGGRNVSFKFRDEVWDGRFESYKYPQSTRNIWIGVIAPSHELRGEGFDLP